MFSTNTEIPHSVPPVRVQDVDGDKRISLSEWRALFFHDEPQAAAFVDGKA